MHMQTYKLKQHQRTAPPDYTTDTSISLYQTILLLLHIVLLLLKSKHYILLYYTIKQTHNV